MRCPINSTVLNGPRFAKRFKIEDGLRRHSGKILYALSERDSVPGRTCYSFEGSNLKSNTRPEAQPRHIVDSETAKVIGRYSGGNHSSFSEFQLIQVRSELTLGPSNRGTSLYVVVGSISETEGKQMVPQSVSRRELVMSNNFTSTPMSNIWRHSTLLASHSLTVPSSEPEARSFES